MPAKRSRVIGTKPDVTERKQSEARLLRLNRTLQAHTDCLHALLSAEDEPTYLHEVCRIVAEICGHALVWIGYAEQDEAKTVRPVASAGFEQGYLETLRLTWADAERGRGPTGTAIRTGRPDRCKDIQAEPRMAPWRAEALKRGLACSLVLPLLDGTQAFGAITIYGHRPNAFSDEEIQLLNRLATDVAHGIATLRLRQAHAAAEEALRHSEHRLAMALEGGRMGLWDWDLKTNRSVWNATEYQLLGLPQGDGHPPTDLFLRHVHSEDAKPLERSLQQVMQTGSDWYHEFRIIRADGQTRWLAGAGRLLPEPGGQPARMISVNYDITERKAFQDELQRLVSERTAKLQELVTELEHFSYTITHDMRAPLRTMQAFAEMFAEACAQCPQQDPRRLLQHIRTSAGRMDALIRDALSYSEAIRKHLPLSPVDAGQLLRGMLDTYPELQGPHACIQVQPEMPSVLANEAGLTQVFSHLLHNAIKFAKPGQPADVRIRAELTPRPPEQPSDPLAEPKPIPSTGFRPIPSLPNSNHGRQSKWVRIWVEDRGVGIPETMLPRVFNMFARGTNEQSGTGIGLALVRKVVDRMGGRVGVESQPGHGSRFWLELAPAN